METPVTSIVYLVEDDAGVRETLRAQLKQFSADWTLVEFGSAEDFLSHFRYSTEAAQCLVLDIALPGMDGVALQHELRQRQIAIPVVMLTGLSDVPLAVQAVQAGALDVIQKPASASKLASAIRIALDNDRTNQRRRSEHDDVMARIRSLSPREREVMDDLLTGSVAKEIAAKMHIGTQTVLKHRARVLRKMQSRGEIELSQLLQSLGLIQPGVPSTDERLTNDIT